MFNSDNCNTTNLGDVFMRKPALCIILLSVFGLSISAETVMLFSEKPDGIGNTHSSVGYVEDGIMDVFFSAGHIIFNGGYQQLEEKDNESQKTFADTISFRMAKSGGADYILQVQLLFTDDEENALPVKALYQFYRLESEEILADGEVLLTEAGDQDELEDQELIRRMGAQLGTQALRGM